MADPNAPVPMKRRTARPVAAVPAPHQDPWQAIGELQSDVAGVRRSVRTLAVQGRTQGKQLAKISQFIDDGQEARKRAEKSQHDMLVKIGWGLGLVFALSAAGLLNRGSAIPTQVLEAIVAASVLLFLARTAATYFNDRKP